MTPGDRPTHKLRNALLLALLLAAVIVIPRSWHIASGQSPAYDADKHFYRGVQFLERDLGTLVIDNPPLGPGLLALPLWATGLEPAPLNGRAYTPLLEYNRSIETINSVTAIWSGTLFLALVGVAFVWCWKLYGPAAAWLSATLLVFEPNFAGHVAVIGTDVLGTLGVVGGAAVCWWWSRRPTWTRTAAAATAIAAAMLLKHTAILLPLVAIVFALLNRKSAGQGWRPLLGRIAGAAGMTLLAIWALTLFDVSRPLYPDVDGIPAKYANHPAITLLTQPWPAGSFVRSLLSAFKTSQEGAFNAYLLGERYVGGRLSYFPVVASLKVPIAVMSLLAVAIASLFVRRPRWAEWSLVVPLVLWAGLTLTNNVNVGFRHALPLYVLMLLLACRCMALGRTWRWAGGTAAALLIATTVIWHPHYLVYDNGLYAEPHKVVTDSNVDWAHALPAVADYVDAHPQDGPFQLVYIGPTPETRVAHYLGDHVNYIGRDDPVPTTGTLILSPIAEVGVFDDADRYREFRERVPDELIAETMRVYRLDGR